MTQQWVLTALVCLWWALPSSVAWCGGGRVLAAARLRVTMGPPSPSREYQKGDGGVRRQAANLVPINEQIKADSVRVIAPGDDTDEDGLPTEVMVGIFPLAEARKMAEGMDLDLVLINDKGDPPVCKIIDYGKYKYAAEKKKKENAKKQVKSEIKEVKMSYKIDDHDFDVRVRAVQRFLADGDRVKVMVVFKGREMQHKDLGKELLERIYKPIEEIATMDSTPKVEGRSMSMLVGPKQGAGVPAKG